MKLYEPKPIVLNGVQIGQVREQPGYYYANLLTESGSWHGPFKTEQAATDWVINQLKSLRDKLNQALEEKP